MTVRIDPHSGVPVYRQVVEQIRFQIASGLLRPGDELPSTRVLSQELGVNPMTVSKSYQLLEHAGIVVRRAGLPLVVADITASRIEDERTEQLRSILQPAARAARQLGIGAREATTVFSQLLSEASTGEGEP
jgi:GntR family transcriptional regulator